MLQYQPVHPYQGNYKQIKTKGRSNDPVDEFEVIALAARLNITREDMANMSFVSLTNILLSSVEEHEQTATQDDINKFFG